MKNKISLETEGLVNSLKARNVRRIYLVGSVGSGKTTLGKLLAEELHISFFEMDNHIFERSTQGDRKRSDNEITELIKKTIGEDNWLIEGTCLKEIVQPIFDESQVLIFLDVPYFTRVYRFSLRFLKQKIGIEEANYKPTFFIYKQMFKWNHQFKKEGHQLFLDKILRYPDKVIYFKY